MRIRIHTPCTVNITSTGVLSVAIVIGALCLLMLVSMLSGCSSATAERGDVGAHVNDACQTVMCAAIRAVS